MSKELFDAVQMLAQEKGIPEDYLYEKISAAIVVAAKHDYNGKDIVHCDIDPEKQRFKVYVTKNVVEEVEDPDKPAGTIVSELQTGYMINDRILREAMVIVTKGGPTEH